MEPVKDAGVHAIGNGKVCAYASGVELFQLFGPVLSAPSFVTVSPLEREAVSFAPTREFGSAVWQNGVSVGGKSCGVITDYTDPELPVFIRNSKLSEKLRFVIEPQEGMTPILAPDALSAGLVIYILELTEGTLFYKTCWENGRYRGYPTDRQYYMAFAAGGDAEVEVEDGKIILDQSQGPAAFSFSASLGEAVLNARLAVRRHDEILAGCRKMWSFFTSDRKNRMGEAPQWLDEAADFTAVLIKAQQGAEGGILAGYNYHLSYVRDNYGDFRGLMALGCLPEAVSLLRYYAGVYLRRKEIHNAQGIGIDAFHIHENDASEIPSYLILMAAEGIQAAQSTGLFDEMLPLIQYSVFEQCAQMRDGMLPFNGDETYIAGGMLGREVICDGSAEATMLFHEALCALLELSREYPLPIKLRAVCEETMTDIKSHFAKNFLVGGRLACNNPAYGAEPPWRNGVRECGHGFGTAFRHRSGRYVCLQCLDKPFPTVAKETRFINSVALMPGFIGSSLVPQPIIDTTVNGLVAGLRQNDSLPSSLSSNRIVGYDFGLAMFSLASRQANSAAGDREAAEFLRRKILALRDADGGWSEYYSNGVPDGTRCRPWESAVNIAALLCFHEKFEGSK